MGSCCTCLKAITMACCNSSSIFTPLPLQAVLFQYSKDQCQRGHLVGQPPDHVSPSPHLTERPLQRVRRPDPFPVRLRESIKGQAVGQTVGRTSVAVGNTFAYRGWNCEAALSASSKQGAWKILFKALFASSWRLFFTRASTLRIVRRAALPTRWRADWSHKHHRPKPSGFCLMCPWCADSAKHRESPPTPPTWLSA
jgi:hypothetical protein